MTQTLSRDFGQLAHPIRRDHPGDGKPPWKDNAFLVFWDPGNEVFGVVHVSTSPNAEGRRARASFSVRGRVAEVAEELEAGSWQSESIEFDPDGTRIEVDTPEISASLEVSLRGQLCDYNANNLIPALVEGEAPQHFQGAVVVTGSVSAAGESSEIDGVGVRDRTWGFRDESKQWPEYYGIVLDIGGRLLTIMKFAQLDGGSLTDGFVLSDADPVPATEISGLRRDASGLFAAATVTTSEGEKMEVRMTSRLAGFWVPMGWEREGPTMSAYDELIEVTTAEGERGYGLVEQGIVRNLC